MNLTTGSKGEKRERFRAVRYLLLLLLAFALFFSFTEQGRQFWQTLYRASGFGGDVGASLSIHVLDVGKADAILLECEGHTALLDAGTALHGETVADYMSRRHVENLDYAIVSHPDKDHTGGMPEVLSEIECGLFVRSRYYADEYGGVNEVLREYSIPQRTVSPGDVLELGGARLEILGPIGEYPDTNNASLVFRLEYRGFTALFCGDIEKDAEKDLVKAGVSLSADLLKVPHHGSDTSCSKRFLQAVDPQYAIISVGRDNNDLPKEKILRRLEDVCTDVYRTDVDGTVVFTYGENGIEVRTQQ